jgi:hypothetical protein
MSRNSHPHYGKNAPEHMGHVTHEVVGASHGGGESRAGDTSDGGKWSNPPISSEHKPQSAVREEHYPHGGVSAGSKGGNRNEREGHGVLGDLNRSNQTTDSPVREHNREMPDKEIVTKAQEVAGMLHKHGEGEGFPGGGVLGR